MRTQTPISEEKRLILERYLKESRTKTAYRRVLCLWMRVVSGLPPGEIAENLGLSINTVHQIQSDFKRNGEQIFKVKGSGGNRSRLLEPREEIAFLRPYINKAASKVHVPVSEIHKGYEEKVGKTVNRSTVYQMLKRRKWFEKHAKRWNEKYFEDAIRENAAKPIIESKLDKE